MILVENDNGNYSLADGQHRIAAYKNTFPNVKLIKVAVFDKIYRRKSHKNVSMGIYRVAISETEEISKFLFSYVNEHGGLNNCRHGGCFELAEAFMELHSDAEMLETWELPDHIENKYHLPLIMPFDKVNDILREEGADTVSDIGILGGHAVVKWKGYIFDANGISTLEEITKYFHTLENAHWIRTG